MSDTAQGLKPLEAPEIRALSVALDRLRFAKMNGLSFNGQRDFYAIFGWPEQITLADYREKYERGGLAKRLVDCFPAATWRGGLRLFEDADPNSDTEFERAWKSINDRLNVWSVLQRADTLAGLSTFSVLLIGAPGELSTELPKGSPDRLIYLTPYLGGGGGGARNGNRERLVAATADASIQSYDEDVHSPRFGEPLTYTLKRTSFSSPAFDKPVHFSRIIHIAEGCLEDSIWGVPTLQNVFNLLLDLEKVTGGGSESYFQRAKHTLNLNIQKDAAFTDADKLALKDKYEEYVHGISNLLPTREIDVKLLDSAVANFSGPADAIIKQIAGSKGIPLRILTGAETAAGQESKDADNWNTQIQDRRTAYAGPLIVRRLVDRLIAYNYLPKPAQYDMSWATEEDMSEPEKAAYAVQLATANKTQGATIVTDDEIREMAFKLEPLTPEQKTNYAPPAAPGFGGASDLNASDPNAPAVPVDQPLAVMEAHLDTPEMQAALRSLEIAIETNDTAAIDAIIGVAHA